MQNYTYFCTAIPQHVYDVCKPKAKHLKKWIYKTTETPTGKSSFKFSEQTVVSLKLNQNNLHAFVRHWVPEMSTGLDWIRTMMSFVNFGLDPAKCFINLGSRPDLDWVNGKDLRNFFIITLFC